MWMSRWVVSYDISEDKARQKIAKILLDYGERVQYSVFECELEKEDLKKLIGKLSVLIDGGDSIRYYMICQSCRKKTIFIGRSDMHTDLDFFIV